MHEFPETRDSLLLQVRNPANRDAWEAFAQIYRPVIIRAALARGLQDADAQDLSQTVLLAVAKAIGKWEKRDESTRFRHWLSRITKNAILNALTRRARDQAIGGDSGEELLQDVVERDEPMATWIDQEYRRELYRRAVRMVRGEFRPQSWQAFELTVGQGMPIEEAAAAVGKSVGAIYTARSRIMFRLREVISQLEE